MRVVVDTNVVVSGEAFLAAVEYLRSRGYDVVRIAEVSPGVEDPAVLARGRAEARGSIASTG